MRPLAIVVAFLAIGVAPIQARADGRLADSQALIEGLAAEAIKTLTADEVAQPERQREFRDLLSENFAVTGIARFALGRYWRGASEDEKSEYVQLFRDLIVATWADRFLEYAGETFEVLDAEMVEATGKESVTLVRSLFFSAPDNPVRIDWRVGSDGDVYRVTDVVIEGLSMAHTYRDEFASVVRRDGLGALLANLRSRSNPA